MIKIHRPTGRHVVDLFVLGESDRDWFFALD